MFMNQGLTEYFTFEEPKGLETASITQIVKFEERRDTIFNSLKYKLSFLGCSLQC